MTAEAQQPVTEPPAPERKTDPRDLTLAVLVGTLLSPFVGMLRALTCRLFWGWFIAPQYGEGPSLKTWFGIGILIPLIKVHQEATTKEPAEHPVWRMIESTVIGVLMLGGTIVAAAMARVVWGW